MKRHLPGRSSVTRLTAREGDPHFCWTEDTGLPSKPQVQDETRVDSWAPAGTGRAPGAGTVVLLPLPRPGRVAAQSPGQAGRQGAPNCGLEAWARITGRPHTRTVSSVCWCSFN